MIGTMDRTNEQLQLQAAETGNRRRSPRYPVEVSLSVWLSEDRFGTSGRTVNLSRHGALLRTAAPLRAGARYELYLQDPDEVQKVGARVVRELPGFLYAVEFDTEVRALTPGHGQAALLA